MDNFKKDYLNMSLKQKSNLENIIKTDIYCITGEKYSKGRSNIEVVKEMLAAGIKVIQYREKEKSMREKYKECVEIRKLTVKAKATFIVNDHVDLALAVGADGVHIGQDDLPIEKVKELVSKNLIIGLSTHTPEQARDAVQKGADYIGVGPIFPTNTKKDINDIAGFEYLDYVVKYIELPLVAIGGIKEENVSSVWKKGVDCVCLITDIVKANNIQKKICNIRKQLK